MGTGHGIDLSPFTPGNHKREGQKGQWLLLGIVIDLETERQRKAARNRAQFVKMCGQCSRGARAALVEALDKRLEELRKIDPAHPRELWF